MRKIFIAVFCLLLGLAEAFSQESHKEKTIATPAAQMDQLIADRMQVLLGLTNTQRDSLYKINKEISENKKKVFKESTDRSLIGQELQRLEDSRDARYSAVLSADQFMRYKKEKKNLFNPNRGS